MPDNAHLSEEYLYDVRLIERHLDQHLVTEEAYQSYLKGLANQQEHADTINLEQLAASASARRHK